MTPHAKPWQKTAQGGPEMGVAVFDPAVVATIIKDAKRPVLVIGAMSLKWQVGNAPYIETLLRLARAAKLPVVATAHSNKYIADKGIKDLKVYVYPLVNLVNRLEDDRAWNGFDGGGKPDLIIYAGITTYYISQMLSSNKNFTEHLQTLVIDNEFQPNARFSLGNVSKAEWEKFLEALISKFA
nr:CO dehydrogenase/acetyl-CoA synthase complex subunit epsilon [Candidatus Sigynarchaeota archaeon]